MSSRAEPYLAERLWAHPSTIGEGPGTTHFENGRPVRTEYPDGEPETYEYDSDGRLVVIEESVDLWTTGDGERLDTGGRLELVYDDRGLKAIGDAWERLDEPWEELLARGAAEYERAVASTLEEHVERGAGVFALVLVYVGQGSLHPVVTLGLEEERPDDPVELMYPEEVLEEVEDDEDLDRLLLRNAALSQPGDPYRAVLGEVCRRLARRDWGGLIVPADDFVVYCAEHDEDVDPKVEMIRAVNPPERVKHWEPVFRRLASED